MELRELIFNRWSNQTPMRLAPSKTSMSAESLRASDQALAQRALPAVFTYPLVCLVLGFAAGDWPNPWPFYGLSAIIMALAVPRWILLRRVELFDPRSSGSWRRWHRVLLLTTVGAWSLICVWTVASFGLDESTFLAMLISAAMAGSVIINQAPDLLIVESYIAITLLPPAAALFWLDQPTASWLALIVVVYSAYLAVQGVHYHRDFHQILAHRELLAQRAVELEEARDAREQDYRRIFDNAHDAILVFDPESERILNVNQRACKLYGFERSEFVNMSLLSISREPTKGRQHIRRTLTEEKRQGFHSFETTQFRKDGSEILIEVNASIVEHQGKRAILSINRDITERRRTEEMRVLKEAAERADQAKGEFLARMSHEVRTPMSGILGVTELLLRSELPAKGREYAEVVQASAQGLLRVVNDILDLSKLEAGKLSIELAPFDLRAVVAEIVDLFEPRASEAGIEVLAEVANELPPSLIGDSARLRQVLLNVVGNAVKYTAEGHVGVRVEAPKSHEEAVRVSILVTDTGIGIAPEDQEKVFTPYQQAASGPSHSVGGTGLGLAICRHLVTLMGGTIELDSILGEGTTVRITLDLEAPPDKVAEPEADVQQSTEPGSSLSGRHRILVADDNPTNRLVTHEQLRSLGYEVDDAGNGREVLAALGKRQYDLVLMDCQMPGLDGYETTRRIRAMDGAVAEVPVIAHTASAMKGDRERCLDAGMQDYLSKPYRLQELAEMVARWLAT